MSRRPSRHARPSLPTDHRFDIAAYEHRAIRTIHDAMQQLLAGGQAKAASETAVLLLDRLKSCWLAESLDDFYEFCVDWKTGELDPQALEHLVHIGRVRDEEFGELETQGRSGA